MNSQMQFLQLVAKIIANTTIKIENIKLIFLIMFLCFVSSGMGVFILNQVAYLALAIMFTAISTFYLLKRLSLKTGVSPNDFINKIKAKFMGK